MYKKFINLFVSVVVLFTTFSVVFSSNISAQTVNGRFYFSPSSDEFRMGCEYNLDIMVDPGSNTSNAANIIINYNPSQIEILDDNSSVPGVQIGTGSAYEAYAENIVESGEIKLTGFSVMSTLNTARVFGTIRFRSLTGVTSTSMSIEFTGAGDTLDSNIAETHTSDDILGSVGSGSYTFVSGPCFDDTTPPSISPIYPAAYDVDVPLDSNISVRICDNRTYDTGVDIDTVEISVNGEIYTRADTAYFSYSGDPSCYDITVNPENPFPEDDSVTVIYRAADFRGNVGSRSIVFNIPADIEEIIKIIREKEIEIEECEERECIFTIPPDPDIEKIIIENENFFEKLLAVPMASSALSLLPAIGFSMFEIPYYIMQLISWIMKILGLRKKVAPWGIVYDSVTKSPVARAVVRLFSGAQLKESVVTDIHGVFSFTPEKGVYTLLANRREYDFPSTIVVGDTDGVRTNVYKGGPYTVAEDKAPIKLSIPLDPKKISPTRAYLRKLGSGIVSVIQFLNPIILVLGAIISAVMFIYTKDRINLLWLAVNLGLIGLEIYSKLRAKTNWGVVVGRDGRPIPGVEVGLYDRTYNKLVDVRVTDHRGRFQFTVPGDLYYVKPADVGYKIDEEGMEDGYPVGKKVSGDVVIARRVVFRKSSSPGDVGPDNNKPQTTAKPVKPTTPAAPRKSISPAAPAAPKNPAQKSSPSDQSSGGSGLAAK